MRLKDSNLGQSSRSLPISRICGRASDEAPTSALLETERTPTRLLRFQIDEGSGNAISTEEPWASDWADESIARS